MEQVHHHLESQRLQYRLVSRAQELGWSEPVVIDEDLGRSGSGTTVRPGFSRLLTAVQEQTAGAVFCIEASRLARNNREWSMLIDYCAIVHTLLIDLDGIYDPRNVSDRVFLGMKGTMSEYELGIFRQRAQAAKLEKANRGELYITLSAGYLWTEDHRLIMDPNKRIRDAIYLIFQKFREFGSATQVALWFRSEGIEIPVKMPRGKKNEIIWKLPVQTSIVNILKNPIYAGAYAYGRSKTHTRFVDGQPVKTTQKGLAIKQWKVLLPNHHEEYISWDEYLGNQQRLAQNMAKRGLVVKGAPRRGPALLAGLLRCQRCGGKLHVRYSGSNSQIPRYVCKGKQDAGLTENCISFYGARLQEIVAEEVLHVVEPAAIRAAEQAEHLFLQKQSEKEQSLFNALAQAEYDANRCFEQYNAVDPKYRLAAQNLEKNWNAALEKIEKIKQQLVQAQKNIQPLSEEDCRTLYRLADDLPQTWHDPKADARLKKRILHILIKEIMVDIDGDNALSATIHWVGGKHTQYRIKRRKKGERQNHLHPDSEKIIRELAEIATDQEIARILNLLKIKTASGKTWLASRVATFRRKHKIPVFDLQTYEKKGWVNLKQAAEMLNTYPTIVYRLIKAGILKARQVIKYSPWMIDKEQLKAPAVVGATKALNKGLKISSLSNNPNQLDFG
jgi:DNA invertase Pin-like site-specific DNA recombinase